MRCCPVALVVGYDLNTIILPDTNTAVTDVELETSKSRNKETYEYVVPKSMPTGF